MQRVNNLLKEKYLILLLQIYLIIHCCYLLPYANEVFGPHGTLNSYSLNPTYLLFPNIIYLSIHWPLIPQVVLVAMTSLAILLTFNKKPWIFIALWYGWACLFNSNNFISNPSIPYLGWLLLAMAITHWRPENKSLLGKGAWIILSISYFVSGWAKLKSPSWIDGSAFSHLLQNPLAYDSFYTNLLIKMPLLLQKLITWFILSIELLFVFCIFKSKFRFFLLLIMTALHIAILTVIRFPDLTFAMLLFHYFTLVYGYEKNSTVSS